MSDDFEYSDDGFLSPRDAKLKLKELYQEAGTSTAFLRREVHDIKQRCKDDPFYFLETCFPHRFCQDGKPAWCPAHREIWDACNRQHKIQIISCFRGLGKSTLGNFGKTMYDICHNLSDFIIMGSYNERMVRKLIFPIMLELENNPRLQQLFGILAGTRLWSTQSLLTANGVRIEGLGIGQTIRGALSDKGQRPQTLICDDILNQESARSPIQKDALIHWLFSDLLPAMRPKGWSARVLATMISAESAIFDLCYHDDYKHKTQLTLINILTEGKPTWPERFPHEVIDRYKDSLTEFAWHGEYMMPPIPSSELLFKRSQIQYYGAHALVERRLYTLAFIDPASRTGATSDYSALIVLSLDMDTGKMYVRQGSWYRKATEQEIIDHCYQLDRLYPGLTIYFESNGFQRLFKYIFELQQKLRGYAPKIDMIDRRDDKKLRILGLSPYLNSESLYFLDGDDDQKTGIEDMLTLSLLETHKKDDWPDSLIGAVDRIQTLLRNAGLMSLPSEAEISACTRARNSLDRVIARKPHQTTQWFTPDASQQQVAKLLEKPELPQYQASTLERMVRSCLEKQKPVPCSRTDYLDVRSYLYKYQYLFIQQGQHEKSVYAKNEILRLDARFTNKPSVAV